MAAERKTRRRATAAPSAHAPKQSPAQAKQAILVLGMHRSGTSALTRVLSLMGADLPKNLMGPGVGNDTGHWESNDLVAIHDDMLASAGTSWADWRAVNPDWISSAEAEAAKQRLLAVLGHDYAGSSLFVIKDPRICRFVPLWLDLLKRFGAAPVPILPIRNPLEVAASLRRRDGFPLTKSYLLWLRHVLDAEHASRGLPRAIVTYDMLMDDWRAAVSRISTSTGLRWPRRTDSTELAADRFLADAHRHHLTDETQLNARADVADWVKSAYGALLAMSRGPEQKEHHRTLDQISAEFNKAAVAFGLLLAGETEDAEAHIRDAEARANTALAEREAKLAESCKALAQTQQIAADQAARMRILDEELITTRGRVHEAEIDAATSRQESERRQHELEKTRTLLRDSQADAQRLSGEIALTQQQLDEAQARRPELDRMYRALSDTTDELQTATAELQRLRIEAEKTALLLDERNTTVAAIRADGDKTRFELDVTQNILRDTQREIGVLHTALRDARRENSLVTSALRESQRVALENQQERSRLENQLAIAREAVATANTELQSMRESRDFLQDAKDEAARLKAEVVQLRDIARQEQEEAQRDLTARDEETARLQRELTSLRTEIESERLKQRVEDRQRHDAELARRRFWPLSRLWRRSITTRQREDIEAIRQSGLFDALWYLKRYPDVAATGQDPLTHYVLHGGAEGRDPHPLFDGKWYVDQYPDHVASGLSPLGHYVLDGAAKGCDPNPLFDTDWYCRENSFFFSTNDNALSHFWKTGASIGLDPNPLFDVTWYLHEYPDVSRAHENALLHYLAHGWKEGRNPNPYFDTSWYAKSYVPATDNNLNPLAYYLRFGLELGHETNPAGKRPSSRRPTNFAALEATYDRLSISSPWKEMLQQQAQAAKGREILVSGNVDKALLRTSQGACIYMIYSDRPGLYLRHELVAKAFARSGYAVIIINNCDFHTTEFTQSTKTISDAVIVRKNIGRDFGAWVDFIAQHHRSLAKTNNVILLNDSVLGPTSTLKSVLAKITQREDHIIGLSESYQNGHHVQSSFLYLKSCLFWDERFLSWIATYPHPDDKTEVIRLGEIGLSRAMTERGIIVRSLIDYHDAAVAAARDAQSALISNQTDSAGLDYYQALAKDIEQGVPRNPQHAFWKTLLDFGYPFVKRELFTVNPEGVPELSKFRTILSVDEDVVACIEDEIGRISKPHTTVH